MSRTLPFAALLLIAPFAARAGLRDCTVVEGKGPEQVATYEMGDWKILKISGPVNATLKQVASAAEAGKVVLSGPADATNAYEVWKIAGRLEIKPKTSCLRGKAEIRALITVHRVFAISYAGKGTLNTEGTLAGRQLFLDISGEAEGTLALDFESVNTEVEGLAKLKLTGNADSHHLDVDGVLHLDAAGLSARYCEIDVAGRAELEITARRELDVSFSGSGSLKYHGSPIRIEKFASPAATITAAGE